jgi:hypothetical protein
MINNKIELKTIIKIKDTQWKNELKRKLKLLCLLIKKI